MRRGKTVGAIGRDVTTVYYKAELRWHTVVVKPQIQVPCLFLFRLSLFQCWKETTQLIPSITNRLLDSDIQLIVLGGKQVNSRMIPPRLLRMEKDVVGTSVRSSHYQPLILIVFHRKYRPFVCLHSMLASLGRSSWSSPMIFSFTITSFQKCLSPSKTGKKKKEKKWIPNEKSWIPARNGVVVFIFEFISGPVQMSSNRNFVEKCRWKSSSFQSANMIR